MRGCARGRGRWRDGTENCYAVRGMFRLESDHRNHWVAHAPPNTAHLAPDGIAASTFGFLNLVILVTPRVFQAMAADGVFFPRLARLHPVYRARDAATGAQGPVFGGGESEERGDRDGLILLSVPAYLFWLARRSNAGAV